MDLNFLRWIIAETGPKIYFDFRSCFFFMIKALLCGKYRTEPSSRVVGYFVRTIIARQISPFLLNLNLNPLYSIRGGSTIRAEPLMKKPSSVLLLWNPLYKWKTWSHLTFVLSAILNHDNFDIIITLLV